MKPHVTGLALGVFLLGMAGAACAADVHLHAVLGSTPMVPATDSSGSGEARALVRDDGAVRISVAFAGLASSVTAVELHTGASNATGPIVATLDARETPAGTIVDQQLALDPGPAADVRAGNSYILITTADRPSGALRGQLVPQPVRLPAAP
ncbi:MAG: CHRD domain-containing protein [Luteimonas sp.]